MIYDPIWGPIRQIQILKKVVWLLHPTVPRWPKNEQNRYTILYILIQGEALQV
jgi:hypothetical protein